MIEDVTDIAPGQIMAAETGEIPAVIERALGRNAASIRRLAGTLSKRDNASIITCARGSSDQAAGYFKYLAEIVLGLPVTSIGPSVSSVYNAPLKLENRTLISVSQSGESPDLIEFQAAARASGAFTIALVNRTESPLAATADEVLEIAAGPELSIPATKSAVGAMAVLASLVAEWANETVLRKALDRLPATCETALTVDWGRAEESLVPARSAYLVGRGPALPIAGEAALKLKETAAIHAEAYSGAEILHGPLQLVDRGFPILMFSPDDDARPSMDALSRRLAAEGAEVISTAQNGVSTLLPFAATGSTLLDPLSMLTSFYGLAMRVACRRGFDPDQPSRLAKVTRTT